MGSIIIWMDGRKTVDIFMGDYGFMRRVSAYNNIDGIGGASSPLLPCSPCYHVCVTRMYV